MSITSIRFMNYTSHTFDAYLGKNLLHSPAYLELQTSRRCHDLLPTDFERPVPLGVQGRCCHWGAVLLPPSLDHAVGVRESRQLAGDDTSALHDLFDRGSNHDV